MKAIRDFKDKVVVVTGTSSGIGETCAKKLLALDAKVAGFDVKPSKITHKNFKSYIVDVADDKGIKAAVDDVDNGFGGIDALVNCAGISSNYKPFYDRGRVGKSYFGKSERNLSLLKIRLPKDDEK